MVCAVCATRGWRELRHPQSGGQGDTRLGLADQTHRPGQATTGHVASQGSVTIGPGRSGRYAITDAAGHRIGIVFGDYVIGFTITCWDLKWTVRDLDHARLAIQFEAEARALISGVASAPPPDRPPGAARSVAAWVVRDPTARNG